MLVRDSVVQLMKDCYTAYVDFRLSSFAGDTRPFPNLHLDAVSRHIGGSALETILPARRPAIYRDLLLTAHAWLADIVASNDMDAVQLANQCLERIDSLPPDTAMTCFGRNSFLTTTLSLEFLGTHWLRDEHIDAGLSFVSQQFGHRNTIFLSTFHLPCLRSYRRDRANGPYNPRKPRFGDTEIVLGQCKHIVIPAHVNGNHWTVFYIDLESNTISYADSRAPGADPPYQKYSDLEWWLTALLPDSHFRLVPGNPPLQTDTDSCGVVVLSSVAARILGAHLWSQEMTHIHRMLWFLQLTGYWLEDNVIHLLDPSNDTSSTSMMHSHIAAPLSEFMPDDDWLSIDDAGGDCAAWLCTSAPQGCLPLPPLLCATSEPTDSPAPKIEHMVPVPVKGPHLKEVGLGEGSGPSTKRRKGPHVKTAEERLASFRAAIRAIDPGASFDSRNICRVCCGRCGKWRVCKEYDIERFNIHRKSCLESPKLRGYNLSITDFVQPRVSALGSPVHLASDRFDMPCAGLTAELDRRIETYLLRTAVPGGGAPSRYILSQRLFGISWPELSPSQERSVRTAEEHAYLWRNRLSIRAIFSTKCQHTVRVSPKSTRSERTCSSCHALFQNKVFKNGISRRIPDDENRKFVPHWYRENEIGELYLRYHGLSELVKKNINSAANLLADFARGVISGTFKNQEVLLGAIKATVVTQQREAHGKDMRGMKWPSAFDNVCAVLATISPRAYRTFRSYFGGRTLRSFRMLRRKTPTLLPGTCQENIDAAVRILQSYAYTGPVVLACDDTKLEPVLREFMTNSGAWVVIGNAGEPLLVQNDDDLNNILDDTNVSLAEKLRLWILIIPIPKVPPIILTSLARGSSDDAEELFEVHQRLISSLEKVGIVPVGYASDGTEVERKLQRLICAHAKTKDIHIRNSHAELCFTIPIVLLSGRPMVMIQDSKHGAKTARNQLFTGARLLALGNFPMFYDNIRELAHCDQSPLFLRDVENLDRQDDRAAARLFSFETLALHAKHFPDRPSVALYLFFLGGLFDAWQSRSISLLERVRLVLRCRFFLHAWQAHIDAHPNHSRFRQFISRESMDIFSTLCDSLIGLIISYREHYPEWPFLPWLHSTESLEHVFGVLRQLKMDFNYADFLNFASKLCAFLMGAFGTLNTEDRANLMAAGYWHTYANDDDLNLDTLMLWPSDDEIMSASNVAFEEVVQVLKFVGIDADAMLTAKRSSKPKRESKPPPPPRSQPSRACPSLMRLPESIRNSYLVRDEVDSLSELMRKHTNVTTGSDEIRDQLEVTAIAYAAADMQESDAIDALPQTTDDILRQASANIKDFVAYSRSSHSRVAAALRSLPPVKLVPLITEGSPFDVSLLISDRKKHQNKFTSDAVRKSNSKSRTGDDQSMLASSIKSQLAVKFVHLLESVSIASGYTQRQKRYGTGSGSSKSDTGIAAAEKHESARRQCFKALFADFTKLHPQFDVANVTSLTPLDLSKEQYILLLVPGSEPIVAVGQVLTMYTLSNRRHAPVQMASTLGSLSYISVQIFSRHRPNVMTSISCPLLGSATFAHVPPANIIFSFSHFKITRQTVSDSEGTTIYLTLDKPGLKIFDAACARQATIVATVKAVKKKLRTRTKPAKDRLDSPDVSSDEENEEGED